MELAQLQRVMAGIASAQGLRRIGGGSETDVYTDEAGRYVYKVKELTVPKGIPTAEEAHAEIETMRVTAERFATYLGAEHSIPTTFLLSEDGAGRFYAVAVQPYLRTAQPLAAIELHTMGRAQRTELEWQLVSLLRGALHCYHETGHMPDLYGTFSRNTSERLRMNAPLRWPWRVWLFFTQRLWSAHNLLLTDEPAPRVVLVDYDRVRWRGLWGRLYYAICWLLFGRDLVWLTGRKAADRVVTRAWATVSRVKAQMGRATPPAVYAEAPKLERVSNAK